ncbi:MAG TPA: hypothetical protein VMI54_21695 [Polyangiaceae bacterium]|nr:hypothetical protein [Polyangiaceae bacterium]
MLKPTLFFGCCAAFAVAWGGCGPTSIELHHESSGEAGSGGDQTTPPAAETGGSSATSGGSSGSGGSAAGGGAMASGGAASGILFSTDCDYSAALKSCNTLGCHSASYPAASLNLVFDSNLVKRLKDVPATFGDIFCTDHICDTPPAACPPLGTKLLVDSAEWQMSWMIAKMRGETPGCGVSMPDTDPPDTFAASDEACLEEMVQVIAGLPN